MIAVSAKHYSKGRHGVDTSTNQRQQEFLKDQKMMVAETAIADQYAAAMMPANQSHGRNFATSNNDADPLNMTGPVMSGMTHSYRNVGGNHSVAIPGGSSSTTHAKSG